MSKKLAAKKSSPAKKTARVPAAGKNNKPTRSTAPLAAKISRAKLATPPISPVAAQRVFAFIVDAGASEDGDRIVEVFYPGEVDGEVLGVFFQPAREAGAIPDDWTEQHAVQLLRFSREPGGSATVRIHRIDSGWVGQGWAGNLVLHVLVVLR